MDKHEPMPRAEVLVYLRTDKNWGRWGPDDQMGALNLISSDVRKRAAALVRTGRVVSLARRLDNRAGPGNPHPLGHEVIVPEAYEGAEMGAVEDRFTMRYHGWATTHLDALCHTWGDEEGMWGGRNPLAEVTPSSVGWGDVTQWTAEIVGRGVLLDIPSLRDEPFVELDRPVEASELANAAERQGVEVQAGDLLVVYCGREAWERQDGGTPYRLGPQGRPGVGSSCVPYIREHDRRDAAVGHDRRRTHDRSRDHLGLWCRLGRQLRAGGASRTCAELGQYDFLLIVAPLPVPGATGSQSIHWPSPLEFVLQGDAGDHSRNRGQRCLAPPYGRMDGSSEGGDATETLQRGSPSAPRAPGRIDDQCEHL